MTEEGRPTGITRDDAHHPGRIVDFEGRQAEVVSFSLNAQVGRLHSASLVLDLGDERLELLGYFSSGDEFIELGRRRLEP